MNTDPSTLLLTGGAFTVPGGVEGRDLVEDLTFDAPSRSEGRTPAHRERFCLVALLRHLLLTEPSLFPATIFRNEAPDFLIHRPCGAAIAIEHTDAGEPHYQRFLSEIEHARSETVGPTEVVSIPSPGGDGWIGDAPERTFIEALRASFLRKSAEQTWRNAPASAERWLLIYDQTNTSIYLSNSAAAGFLRCAAQDKGGANWPYDRIYLVRSQEIVLGWRQQKSTS